MSHIRFFYSDKQALELLKDKFLNDSEKDIYNTRNIIQLNFCLDYPLELLKNDAYDYFIQFCNEHTKEFSAVEYNDLLHSLLFLIASNYNLKDKNNKIQTILKLLNNNIIIDDDELKNYAKVYIKIIINYFISNDLDRNYIKNNKNLFENLFDEFLGLIDKDYSILYDIISMELVNINRMKRQYFKIDKLKTIGYQNFSDMYATIGKIKFWEMIGIKLDYSIINDRFESELGKDFKYFNF